MSLIGLRRFEEAKSVLRKMMPVARRVLGESHELTLKMRTMYAAARCNDADATLDDLRETVATVEDTRRIALRVLGSAHPITAAIEVTWGDARAALSALESPQSG